ncbi:hypothetical protein Rsub_09500 [Raphidocelis subcapitata]|uniref:EF-hand domain-containing protein n=1 Tax=Raphidocelis subcapitata TaxID=307507 RepID=A0A2V0PIB9_9CHLO|nr:hypothetical protein Rsub_09500 [Raphidocelis subcapitata]|eukprot:GBF97027.1 hypothetical protein Rsub_09500 [Raphidocelis subcapitata]
MDPERDPRARIAAYLHSHKVEEILQGLLAELLFAKPAEPRAFLIERLERAKAAGGRPLLDAHDLEAMHSMMDPTGAGTVTAAQANAALATALGGARAAEAVAAAAAAAAGGAHPLASKDPAAARLDKAEFVRVVGDVLIRAAPNCELKSLADADDAV